MNQSIGSGDERGFRRFERADVKLAPGGDVGKWAGLTLCDSYHVGNWVGNGLSVSGLEVQEIWLSDGAAEHTLTTTGFGQLTPLSNCIALRRYFRSQVYDATLFRRRDRIFH